jgi:hypothetical protein
LLSISSAIFVSMVCAAMMRHAVTGSVWPMRWLRSMACVCSASVHESSASTMLDATCRFSPTPAAVSEQTATETSGSLTKASMLRCRTDGVWSPRMEENRTPWRVKVSSAASITSTCLAKNTTLPALRASWAA